MHNKPLLPLIGVSADLKFIDEKPFHAVGEKYLQALAGVCQAAPLIIPAMAEQIDIPALVDRLDAVLLTGSPSNVHPQRYNNEATAEHEPYDEPRDRLTFLLIRETLAQQVPLLAICRGIQELNVALGGTLHPAVHALPGRLDHRHPEHPEFDVQYGPSHEVTFIEDSVFARILGKHKTTINSLHRQAIDRLAPALRAEGHAPDGTIEAVSVKAAENFALGVQWHPEYKAENNDDSVRLFTAFADAAKTRARRRNAL